MPVEIKELVVRAVVQAPEEAGRGADEGGPRGLSEKDREALVESCVKEVLGALRRGKER